MPAQNRAARVLGQRGVDPAANPGRLTNPHKAPESSLHYAFKLVGSQTEGRRVPAGGIADDRWKNLE